MSKFGTRSFSLFFYLYCTLRCTILWWLSLKKTFFVFCFYAEMTMRNHWKLTLSNMSDPQSEKTNLSKDRVCFKHTHIIFRQWKSTLVDGNSGTLLLCQTDALAALNCSLLCPWQKSLDGERKTQISQCFVSGWERGKKTKASADTHPDDVCQGRFACSRFTYVCRFCCFSQQSVMENKSCFHKWPIKNV